MGDFRICRLKGDENRPEGAVIHFWEGTAHIYNKIKCNNLDKIYRINKINNKILLKDKILVQI